jgi:hypothetical protein
MLKRESAFPNTAQFARDEAQKIYLSLSNRELITLLNQVSNEGIATDYGNLTEKLREYFSISDLKLRGIYRTWSELSLQFSVVIESMHSEAYIATRYFDFRVAEVGLRAATRGCTLKIIHSRRSGLSTKLQILGNLMTHPKALGIFRKIPSYANVSSCEADLPFSFVVIDSQLVGIEIVNEATPESFFFGVLFDSQSLASKLITYFNELTKIANQEVDYLVALNGEEEEQPAKLGLGTHHTASSNVLSGGL